MRLSAKVDVLGGPLQRWVLNIALVLGIVMTTVAASAVTTQPESSTGGSIGSKIEFVDPAASTLAQGGLDMSPLGMFEAADGVVKGVIRLLLLASVITWAIGLAKWIELRNERRSLRQGMRKLRGAASVGDIGETGYEPLGEMIVYAEDEIAASNVDGLPMPAQGIKDRIALRLDRLEAAARRSAGRGVGILAIVSSTAPFVGLAGTVWGIMDSFVGIAHSHTTNLAVVAPGIAEALLTTAVGLVAAIPAAILYNVFARALSTYAGELGDAGAAILCLAAREVDHPETRG